MLQFKVTLRLSSSEYSLEEFKRVLGEPTRGFSVGDEYSKGKRRREFTLWARESSKLPSDDFEVHLEDILCFLDDKYSAIAKSFSDYEIDLFCMFSTDNGQGGAVLSAGTMKKISSFGLDLIFDVYE
jgi:hypothetical protein